MEIVLMDKEEGFDKKQKSKGKQKLFNLHKWLMHFQVTLHETMEIPSPFLCFFWEAWKQGFWLDVPKNISNLNPISNVKMPFDFFTLKVKGLFFASWNENKST